MRFSPGAALFQVDLSKLRQGGLRVSRPVDSGDLGISKEDADVQGPVLVHLELVLKNPRIMVGGDLRGLVRVPCRRCLELLESEVIAPVDLSYRWEGAPSRGHYDEDLDDEDLAEEAEEDGLVRVLESYDVAPGLRDCFLLAVPARPVCREECKGLCPQCGTNLNLGSCGCGERT